ncbi:MAG TPA: LAGLIDADG family homing endonuclease [Anaerolineae bacterium]|nr:LAGLIDADG family homing endonuclease [Anaerolineae bacterium]
MPRFNSKTQLSRAKLEQLYIEQLLPTAEIARRLGCGETTVLRALHDYGIPVRSKSDYRLEIPREELERLYVENGFSEDEIAQWFHTTQITISRRLIEFGITTRQGGVATQSIRPSVLSVWSPELAYAVGLIASDGNLDSDRVRVEFVSTDRELIDLYCEALGLDSIHVGETSYKSRKPWYKVRISDRTFRNFLEKIGLTPAKSKTLGELQIPDKFFADFLRGVLDGDGSWYIHKSLFGRYQYLRVELSSASSRFIKWIEQKIIELGGMNGIWRTRSLGRYHYLTFIGKQALELGRWVYYAPDVLALSRKRRVWEEIQNRADLRSRQ